MRSYYNHNQTGFFSGVFQRFSAFTVFFLLLILFACSKNEIEENPPPPSPPETAASTPASINLSPESVVLGTWAETANFTAQVIDQYGNQMSGASVVWSSSDTTVVRINSNGQVSTRRPGTAKIKASLNSINAEAPVEIRLQMNTQCPIPTGASGRGPVAGMPSFVRVDNVFDVRLPRFGMTMVAPVISQVQDSRIL